MAAPWPRHARTWCGRGNAAPPTASLAAAGDGKRRGEQLVCLGRRLALKSKELLNRFFAIVSGSERIKAALVLGGIPETGLSTVVFVPVDPLECLFSGFAQLRLSKGVLVLLRNQHAQHLADGFSPFEFRQVGLLHHLGPLGPGFLDGLPYAAAQGVFRPDAMAIWTRSVVVHGAVAISGESPKLLDICLAVLRDADTSRDKILGHTEPT